MIQDIKVMIPLSDAQFREQAAFNRGYTAGQEAKSTEEQRWARARKWALKARQMQGISSSSYDKALLEGKFDSSYSMKVVYQLVVMDEEMKLP
jgi:hypothetical protein